MQRIYDLLVEATEDAGLSAAQKKQARLARSGHSSQEARRSSHEGRRFQKKSRSGGTPTDPDLKPIKDLPRFSLTGGDTKATQKKKIKDKLVRRSPYYYYGSRRTPSKSELKPLNLP